MNEFLIKIFGWTGDGVIDCFYLINFICQIVHKKIVEKKGKTWANSEGDSENN